MASEALRPERTRPPGAGGSAARVRSPADAGPARTGYGKRGLLAAALLYSAFVVYGSLVPLRYRALPLDEAIARFRAIPWLDLGIGSRADWVANILLFVPLAFLWLGMAWPRRGVALRVLAILIVLAVAVALSLGIEFTQIYFPPRTVSQNDLLAEAIGALVGVALWCALGPRLIAWVDDWARGRGTPGAGERLLYVYLAGLFAYNLLPLDLTVSPVEVFHKFREGRLVVIPFGGLPPQPMQALYDLATDVLIWVPVGLLWRVGGRAPGRALRDGLLFGLLIEFLQLWVFSRVSDVTDVFTAGFGAWLGALAGGRLWRETQAVRDTGGSIDAAAVFSLLGILAWTGALAAIFWYPFDFNTDGQFLRERVGALRSVPFTAYYYGTEFRAATEVLHKVLFFAPLGMLLGCALSALRWRHAWAWVFGVTIAAGVAGVIEAVQLALPGKNADITDWVLECAGAIGGFWIARAVLRSHFSPRRTPSRRPAPGSTRREGAPRA